MWGGPRTPPSTTDVTADFWKEFWVSAQWEDILRKDLRVNLEVGLPSEVDAMIWEYLGSG